MSGGSEVGEAVWSWSVVASMTSLFDGSAHPLGTDDLGRDNLSRVARGTRISRSQRLLNDQSFEGRKLMVDAAKVPGVASFAPPIGGQPADSIRAKTAQGPTPLRRFRPSPGRTRGSSLYGPPSQFPTTGMSVEIPYDTTISPIPGVLLFRR